MERDFLINLVINLGILLILIISFTFLSSYFYNMKSRNCNSIMNADYNVATDEVSSCMKFRNFPIVNFWIPYWLTFTLIYVFLTLIQWLFFLMLDPY